MEIQGKTQQLRKLFNRYPSIKLVYLFGSRATKKQGPLSDFDFAVYLAGKDRKKNIGMKAELTVKISEILKTDKIDIVLLNTLKSPELKYNIIKEGKLIYEKQPFKVLIEPYILNQYFDFHSMLLRYNLTKI